MGDELARKPEMKEVATAEKDIDLFCGWTTRMENPDLVIKLESRGLGVRIYEDLYRDWQVSAMHMTRNLALQGCEWQVEPVTERREDRRIAEFVTKVMKEANFDRLSNDLMQAVICGFKPVEVMWEASEGDVWIKEFRGRRPSRFVFDMESRLRLLTIENTFDGDLCPDRKFVVWRFGGFDAIPYGLGLGHQLYWPVWFKKNDVKFWLIFAENFGSPTPIGKYPSGTSDAGKKDLLAAIKAIRQETGITIPETMAIEYLEASRSGTINTYHDLCTYMDRAIAKLIVGQVLTSEPGDVGSLAMGKVHNEVRHDIMKSDGDSMCEAINNSVVKWLVDFNFPAGGKKREYPKIWRRTEPVADLKEMAARDKILLVDMGMARRVPEQYIADTYGLPLASEGERVIGLVQAGGGSGGQDTALGGEVRQMGAGLEYGERRGCPACGSEFAEGDGRLPGDGRPRGDPERVDKIIGRLSAEAAPLMEHELDPLRRLVMGAKSLEDLRDTLLDAYAEMKPADLGALMAEAMTAAELLGQVEIAEAHTAPSPSPSREGRGEGTRSREGRGGVADGD